MYGPPGPAWSGLMQPRLGHASSNWPDLSWCRCSLDRVKRSGITSLRTELVDNTIVDWQDRFGNTDCKEKIALEISSPHFARGHTNRNMCDKVLRK